MSVVVTWSTRGRAAAPACEAATASVLGVGVAVPVGDAPQPVLEPHPAAGLVAEPPHGVADLYRRARQPVGVRRAVRIGPTPRERGRTETCADLRVGVRRRRERLGVGEVTRRHAELLADALDGPVELGRDL